MIRPYEEADKAECAAVYCSAFTAPPWNENWTDEIAQRRVKELMCSPVSYGYVIEENGQICGFAAGRVMTYLYGREYVIDEFCVTYETQGRGIGSRLMQHILQDMKERGIVGVVLNTTKGYPSERFYLKNGFRQNPDMITMFKELHGA